MTACQNGDTALDQSAVLMSCIARKHRMLTRAQGQPRGPWHWISFKPQRCRCEAANLPRGVVLHPVRVLQAFSSRCDCGAPACRTPA